ncbi:MAG: hypothetical protein WBE37_14245, partial [Bryobacteraceae bacterium]
ISVRGHCLELLHSSLRFNLIWFLHSDSPFSRERKFALSLSRLRAGVANFYDLPGIPEKDPKGESHLYPLTDFKPRREENLESGYLQRRYGAIPFIRSDEFVTGLAESDGEAK